MVNGKSYFVWGMALLLAVGTGYYIYNTNRAITEPKTVNNEKVLITIDKDTNITEKQFFERLNKETLEIRYAVWRNTIIDKVITDKDLTKQDRENIKLITKNLKTSTRSQFGDDYEWLTKKELAGSGFTNCKDYATALVKASRMKANWVKEHLDDYKEAIETIKPRKALVVSITTDEEAKKEANTKNIHDLTTYYEGYADKNTQGLPQDLLTKILERESDGETDWVDDASTGQSYKALVYDIGYEANEDATDMFDSLVYETNTEDKIMYENSKNLKIEYVDKEFEKDVEEYLKKAGVIQNEN